MRIFLISLNCYSTIYVTQHMEVVTVSNLYLNYLYYNYYYIFNIDTQEVNKNKNNY